MNALYEKRTSLVEYSQWYCHAMESLVGVVQEISTARDLSSILNIVRGAARKLTGADGATFVLRDGDKCYYAEEDAISPLWKGQRFSMKTCISGWVMMNAQPAVIEDIYQDSRIPQDAYKPTFVKSLVMVPIRAEDPIGAIGNYWANVRLPSHEEVSILQALAHVTSVAMENVELYVTLQNKLKELEASNKELSNFAWAAAHDLKSPLRGIRSLSQWIEEDLKVSDQKMLLEHGRALRYRVDRMEKLLDGILEYSHIERRDMSRDEFVTGTILETDILSLIQIPQDFMLTFSTGFSSIYVPRVAMQRILCNLINNSIKHHDRSKGVINLTVDDHGTYYIFSVKDDGPGIDPSYQKRIFEMFQTLKSRDVVEGSGMGLAIVRKILSLYSSDIEVISGPERGCDFRFNFPKKMEL